MEKLTSYLKYLITIAILLFVLLNKILPQKEMMDLIDIAVIVVGIGFTIYSKYIWKINPFEKTPKVYGNYSVTFISNHDKKKRKMDISIEQTLFKTKIKIITKESNSISLVANIKKINDEWNLIYTYENTPNILERNHSDIHYGTCILSIENNKIIGGYYYTDRNTSGDIKFSIKKYNLLKK